MVKSKKKNSPLKRKSDGTKVKYVGAPSHSITPFLMFNANPEEAANFYVSIFKKSKILSANSMQADFILNGQKFFSYNGGPDFQFSWGVSFMISVETQKEVDYYWNALLADGGKAKMCGWLQDKYGMWWQVTPKILLQLISHKDRAKAERATQAMLKMQKIDIAALKAAAG
ncbi:VOC family protein [Leptospira noguchii]|uniref:3-demethylubiquinone-9 3-methyltransferase domain protein n=2 Tax=Leptospira noguchii TaxID=28182 RepID=T0FLC8_9LEPT|nr:VOC family protein [Leptospira noguchii]EMO53099.1 3-demethylubiquinone-9 3-methyltransferase domain protein [Leptospira noguchii]EQA70939.1 3-demethylubiquinone-9 3-methyltransferase domain protein [Leptospira noguchii serovar Panama str. CZ214]MCH1912334.1 VOC family protein [Leptospira noguchii]MCH1916019.1 VOC family protein [Leptospira noguchii]UOG63428.1 VOC family protein [Leptospira noguchii]